MQAITRLLTALTLVGLTLTIPAQSQGGSDAVADACFALEHMIAQTGDASLLAFARTRLTAEYQAALTSEEMLSLLHGIRNAAHHFGGVGLQLRGENLGRAVFHCDEGKVTVDFDLDSDSGKIKRLELVTVEKPQSIEPITWTNLADRLAEEEANGFSGAVLVVRNDSIVLERGYGYSDQARNIPVNKQSIFAIGSTPIDFTHAAILKLEEMGKLRIGDPISRFLSEVPKDKAQITLQQLMSGASGLQDFHDTDEDADPDLTWIDRQSAIDRILGQDLLFEPGSSSRHSHSAWVLLAAIVEITSGQAYDDFLKNQFFDKAGMTRTGPYPLTVRFDPSEIAIGYGPSQPTEVNSPAHWGKTSWLVMGSGGMVSTPGDLYRWRTAMRQGKLLGAAALARYPVDAVGVGGNDRGFLNWFAYAGKNAFVLCSNSHDAMDDRASGIGRALEYLISSRQ